MPMKWVGKPRVKLLRRLVFSAKERCECGAGLAYDRRGRQPIWDCSAILLGDALLISGERGTVEHHTPCAYYEIVSERHPAASGLSTRPALGHSG
jgi:hypothetical protein